MAAQVYVGKVREKGKEFKKKAREHGYAEDAILIGGGLALCQQNPHDPYETFQTFIDLIDTCKDDDEFVAEASAYVGIE